MLEIFDKSLKKLAVLHNASGMIETQNINAIYLFEFQLPDDDPKNEFCLPFHHVRYNDGELYRIMPSEAEATETGNIRYECEHVVATLLDDVMFGFHQVGNLGYFTEMAINYVLSQQTTRKWLLDQCDMNRQFEYGWEQENLLGALFSIPKPSVQPFIWRYDTRVFPFRISLLELNENELPSKYIRKGKNRLSLIRRSDPRQLCTRLFALGAGEGINQLGISSVNAGNPFVQSPQSYIDKYGLISRTWIDRRYTDAQSLLEAALAMLNELQEPIAEYSVSVNEPCELGSAVRIVETGTNHIVTGITTRYNEIPSYEIRISNRAQDIAETVASLADRQRIEMTYAQGATNIYAQSFNDNADATHPAIIRFWVPSEAVQINKVMLTWTLAAFRAYETGAAAGGGSQSSTGQTTTTQQAQSLTSGSANFETSGYWNLNSGMPQTSDFATHWHYTPLSVSNFQHYHLVDIPAHYHSLTVNVNVPDHTHPIQYGIHEGSRASSVQITVGGKSVIIPSGDTEIDLSGYLADSDGMIRRGTHHEVRIIPNGLTRIEATLTVQLFIQSRGGGTY